MKKSKSLSLLLATVALTAGRLTADPLTAPVSVHLRPEIGSPVIGDLTAGTEPSLLPIAAPPGWQAVALAGPHDVFVRGSDLLKDLSVKPGSSYCRLTTGKDGKITETVVGIAVKGDDSELTGPQGRYLAIHLKTPLTGFIAVTPKPAPIPVAPVATAAPMAPAAPPVATAPAPKPAPVVAIPAAPLPIKAGSAGDLPRLFQGVLASTRSPFHPRRPYDYQLNDANGVRYAYVDTSRLPPLDSVEASLGRTVVVYGEARAVPDSTDMVITAENLRIP